MRVVMMIAAALLAVIVIVLVVGWMLPVRHRASRETTLASPPPTVFALITNVSELPAWRPSVKAVEVLPPEGGRRRFREIGRNGSILYSIDSEVPNERVVTRIADPTLPFGGTWTYELHSAGGANTTLRITEDGEVRNPLFRFVSRFVMGHHATIDAYMRDARQRLDTLAAPDR
jgi:uncharacterized protein YndB with AHSA1/START domain